MMSSTVVSEVRSNMTGVKSAKAMPFTDVTVQSSALTSTASSNGMDVLLGGRRSAARSLISCADMERV